jgi:hypothetical protein
MVLMRLYCRAVTGRKRARPDEVSVLRCAKFIKSGVLCHDHPSSTGNALEHRQTETLRPQRVYAYVRSREYTCRRVNHLVKTHYLWPVWPI